MLQTKGFQHIRVVKVKSGDLSKAVPSHEKAFDLANFVISTGVVPENS